MMDNEKSQEILRLITESKIAYQRTVALSAKAITEDERKWIRQVSSDYDPFEFEISPSYFYRKRTIVERNAKKNTVRKELDNLRKKSIKFTPEELIELSKKNVRESRGIENFFGIYLIHNRVRDMYYAGQAVKVFNRAYQHFSKNPALNEGRHEDNVRFNLRELYEDYLLGDEFIIFLIPLEDTSFSSLNELEDNAIRAYDSLVPNGYNRNPGIIMDEPIFKNDDHQRAAELILEKIKGTEIFSSLSNDRKRIEYIRGLLSELVVPYNPNFQHNLVDMIRAYQKMNKK